MAKNNSDFFKVKNQWSEVKDKLLGCYLKPYFQKLLTSGKPICYVDCFAGKGRFDDGKPGSPLIALTIRDDCLNSSKSLRNNCRLDIHCIEYNHASDLRYNLKTYSTDSYSPNIIEGKYEDNIELLLKHNLKSNVFLYIDPYGIRALEYSIFQNLGTCAFNSLEMLINFNSFGFFRDACRALRVNYENDDALSNLSDLVEYAPTSINDSEQSQDLLTKIAGGDYWKAIVNDFNTNKIRGYQAEKRLSNEYKQQLKQKYRYVLDMPIRLKSGHRPKYRMIHISNHEDGCFLMAQNMQIRGEELFTSKISTPQISLFSLIPDTISTLENEIITTGQIKLIIEKQIFNLKQDTGITRFIADFVNENGIMCKFSVIYSILTELHTAGTITITRNPKLTPTGQNSRHWEEKQNKSVTIRKN